MLKLALCDDDAKVIEQLEKYFDKLQDSSIDYDVFFSADELYKYMNKEKVRYDAYILDIEMSGMSGIELAKKIRELEQNSLIVFLTSYSKYVFEVFEVVTFDFLVKPIEFNKFENVINRIREYLHITKAMFVFSYRKNSFSIPCNEIIYIEKVGRKAFLYTCDQTYSFNMTLENIWQQLDEKLFAAIHTSCIVNLSFVREIVRNELTLKTGKKLYVSKNRCQEAKNKHLRFIREKM